MVDTLQTIRHDALDLNLTVPVGGTADRIRVHAHDGKPAFGLTCSPMKVKTANALSCRSSRLAQSKMHRSSSAAEHLRYDESVG